MEPYQLKLVTGLVEALNDRFIVKEPGTENLIDWGEINKPFNSDQFEVLWKKVDSYLAEKDRYLSRVHVGS